MSDISSIRFVAFDLETTGVDPFTDRPVSYGFVERAAAGGYLESGGYVNPGIAIPPGATRVHGITDDMVADAPRLAEATQLLSGVILDTWAKGGVIVGMNVSYDLTMLNSLRLVQGLAPLAPTGPVLDVLIADRHFDRWRKGSRRLLDLCAHYGVALDDAHAAVGDARASLLVFEEQVRRYPELERLEVTSLSDTMGAWYRDWLSSFSKFLESKGEAPIGPGRYAWPVHEVDPPSSNGRAGEI
ncbi:MAG: 3'-5' exonuclease [Acidobacteriota bacterium]|nr:3'-5' exonuclease [Acidobacteriota bacterium]MDE3043816.1 3'-5' exonuclease [Acidobacteriota bacterium]MDE3106710.1 3'-5' exonuclease [Acidobacteriota bacterium]MDE3223218.1 3'-5' exonuclease [Acidobacteriota bacterium]